VVEVGSASSTAHDSTSVTLEISSVGFDQDRYWLLVSSSEELGWVVLLNSRVSTDADSSSTSVVSASLSGGGVAISLFSHKGISSDIIKGLVGPSTVATSIGKIAINELRLGQ
jgi:hypothetical protein